jgi:hypothetical protein
MGNLYHRDNGLRAPYDEKQKRWVKTSWKAQWMILAEAYCSTLRFDTAGIEALVSPEGVRDFAGDGWTWTDT